MRTGRGKILDAVEQMTKQLKQLRKDRDKLTGAQGDLAPSSSAASCSSSAAPPRLPLRHLSMSSSV